MNRVAPAPYAPSTRGHTRHERKSLTRLINRQAEGRQALRHVAHPRPAFPLTVTSSDHNRPCPAHSRRRALDQQTYDALCDLHACVLVLDSERRRLSCRLDALPRPGAVLLERADLERRHAQLTEELAALETTITRLRASVDPESKFL